MQGVGRATALVFARKGWNVVVAARDGTRLQYVANDCAEVAGRQGASLGGGGWGRVCVWGGGGVMVLWGNALRILVRAEQVGG